MRELDQAECRAMGVDPYVGLADARKRSDRSFEVWVDDELLVEWGYRMRSFILHEADVWMLSFHPIEKHKMFAARASIELLDALLERFTVLRCEVHARHGPAIRWLDWLGFRVDGTMQSPVGETFLIMKCRRD